MYCLDSHQICNVHYKRSRSGGTIHDNLEVFQFTHRGGEMGIHSTRGGRCMSDGKIPWMILICAFSLLHWCEMSQTGLTILWLLSNNYWLYFIFKIITSSKCEALAITFPLLNSFFASFKLLAMQKHWPFLSLKAAC